MGIKHVLIVTDCGLRWPTGMVRALQFQPLFESSDSWRAEYTSRHPYRGVKILYGQHRLLSKNVIRVFRPLLNAYYEWWSKRQDEQIVKRARKFDLICLIKTPSLPLYRRLLGVGRPRIIMDINDSLWLSKRGDWVDLDAMLAEVDGVICENEYVASYARRYNRRVLVIEDAPQVEVFDRFRAQIRRDPSQIVLGWIGGSANIWPLCKLLEPLEALFARHPNLHLRVIGTHADALPPFEKVKFSCLPSYSQEEMVREVLGLDIGLFPLFQNEDGRGRGTLKAKIYMSGQAVAVCDNYGENPKLIKDGTNGILVSSPQEWHDKLEWLITHPEERRAIAERGLETIRREYTARRVFTEILTAYARVLNPQ